MLVRREKKLDFHFVELYMVQNDIDPDFFALTKKPFQYIWNR